MSKTFYKFAGVSTHNGVQSVRYANSADRVKTLQRNGHTDIRLIQLPYEGERADAINTLLGLPEFRELSCVQETARELGFRI